MAEIPSDHKKTFFIERSYYKEQSVDSVLFTPKKKKLNTNVFGCFHILLSFSYVDTI